MARFYYFRHSAVVLGEVSFVDQSLKCAINELSTELRDGIHSRLDDEAAYPAASKSKSMVSWSPLSSAVWTFMHGRQEVFALGRLGASARL